MFRSEKSSINTIKKTIREQDRLWIVRRNLVSQKALYTIGVVMSLRRILRLSSMKVFGSMDFMIIMDNYVKSGKYFENFPYERRSISIARGKVISKHIVEANTRQG